jgi:hypothetical protein
VDGNYVVIHPEGKVVLKLNREEFINFVIVKAYINISRLILRIHNEEKDDSQGEELAYFINIEKGVSSFYVPKVSHGKLYRARVVIDNDDEVPKGLIHFTFGIIQI